MPKENKGICAIQTYMKGCFENNHILPYPWLSNCWVLTGFSCYINSWPNTNGLWTQTRRFSQAQLGVTPTPALLGWSSLRKSWELLVRAPYSGYTRASHTPPSPGDALRRCLEVSVQGGFPGLKGQQGPHSRYFVFLHKNKQDHPEPPYYW